MAANPRKQTVVILVLCILFVGGVAFYVYGGIPGLSKARMADTGSASGLAVSSQEVLPVTSDWRKQFLGNNATSTTFKTAPASAATDQTENLTATDLLGRAFLAKYGELQQSGLNKDSGTVNSVMGQVTSQSLANLPSPNIYTTNDLRVVPDSTNAASAFGQKVLNALGTYLPKQNEAEIAQNAFNDNDMTELKALDPIIANYKQLISVILSTPVPAALTGNDVTLLNGVSMSLYNAESFRHMDTDPLRSMAAVSLELVALQNIMTAVNNMQSYFNSIGLRMGPQ